MNNLLEKIGDKKVSVIVNVVYLILTFLPICKTANFGALSEDGWDNCNAFQMGGNGVLILLPAIALLVIAFLYRNATAMVDKIYIAVAVLGLIGVAIGINTHYSGLVTVTFFGILLYVCYVLLILLRVLQMRQGKNINE